MNSFHFYFTFTMLFLLNLIQLLPQEQKKTSQTEPNGGITIVQLKENQKLKHPLNYYNENSIFILTPNDSWLEGQQAFLESGLQYYGSIFTKSGFAFVFYPGKSLLISDAIGGIKDKRKDFVNEFTQEANILVLVGQSGYFIWGIVLSKFKQYFADRGMNENQISEIYDFIQFQVYKLLDSLGFFAVLDDSGNIIERNSNAIAIFFNNGQVGTLIITGQSDPITKKSYNWAKTPDGNLYVGLGLEMVDVKTLLTDAKYMALAHTILKDTTLSIEAVVRITGSWLLQHDKLGGISEKIKKFLNYDTTSMPDEVNLDAIIEQIAAKNQKKK